MEKGIGLEVTTAVTGVADVTAVTVDDAGSEHGAMIVNVELAPDPCCCCCDVRCCCCCCVEPFSTITYGNPPLHYAKEKKGDLALDM